jgi:hypothetical protein
MGPLSLVLRAPFAAIGQAVGHGGPNYAYLDDYRFGVFGCALSVALFGLVLGRTLERLGRKRLVCVTAAAVTLVNPVTLRAIHFGHPEEILGAALLAAAMLAAVVRAPRTAVLLAALALANKQWAAIGVPSVLVILWANGSSKSLRRGVGWFAAATAAIVTPLLLANPGSLWDTTQRMADLRGTLVFPGSLWHGFAPELPPARAAVSQAGVHAMPDWLGLIARPGLLALGLIVPLLLARRVREDVLARAFPLLALVMLIRCELDPADNSWYHAPFLMALVAADGIAGRYYPTAVACAMLAAPTVLQFTPEQLALFYALWAPAFTIYLVGRAAGFDWAGYVRSRVARGRDAAQPRHSSSSSARTP